MKKHLPAFLAAAMLFVTALQAQSPVKTVKTLPFSKGINLPGWLEYSRFNTLRYGKRDFENIKSLGVEVIRIPVWFDIWADKDNGYKVDQECFAVLDNAIEWCRQLGMYLIIDFHNDSGGGTKTDQKVDRELLAIWPQIAARCKDKGDHILYEVMNEPHFFSGNLQADLTKWGKIQGSVIEAIRSVDKAHYIIVGGGDSNSIESMLKLPDYSDKKLIYNFHDYSPFLFTHQGASWTNLKRIKNVPFPYAKDKMPALPPNATDAEKWELANYEKMSSEKELSEQLDRAVEFANKRKAPLMCNEYGVYMNYANPAERAAWYKLKCAWMDQRKIARISWDYTQEFGLFNLNSESRFPEDLNKPLLAAMGYKLPAAGKSKTWFESAKESGDWTIYKNGQANLISARSYSVYGSFMAKDPDSDERYILLRDLKEYDELLFNFQEACDFTSLKDSGAKLEFFIKSRDKRFDITVYFLDSEARSFPWRAATLLTDEQVAPNGIWQKVSIPLKNFNDVGGWTESDGWVVSEKKFSWKIISALVFENNNHTSKEGYALKDIKLVY